MSKIRLGEPPFRSVQGEGNRTGVLSVWIRFGGCNLRCSGFFQDNPADKSTWDTPPELKDPKSYKSLFELPILAKGCDSLYSIDPKFKHLWTEYESAAELVSSLTPLLYDGEWVHPLTDNAIDLCFTGGEPMLQQKAMVEIMSKIDVEDKGITIQIETNGTQTLSPGLRNYVVENLGMAELQFNISPKLFYVTGEEDAVNYNNILEYQLLAKGSILKFVINNDNRAWDELDKHVTILKAKGVNLPIYIMPVGATKEQQEDSKVISSIATKAIERGYHVSGRLHTVIFGNKVGS